MALSGSSNGIKNYHTLYEMFLSEEFDHIIIENGVTEFKSQLLQILSKCHLKDDECDTVVKYANELLKQKPDDHILYSGILRFNHRRYKGMFFITFLSLLENMTPEQFDNVHITNILVDKIEEVKFHQPSLFRRDFNIFIYKLKKIDIPKLFQERILKAGMK